MECALTREVGKMGMLGSKEVGSVDCAWVSLCPSKTFKL